MNDFYKMTAVQLRREIREGRVGVEELTRWYLARIDKYGGADGLNAIAELDDSAIAQARAMDARPARDREKLPLFGLPILAKDNIDVAGLHTTAGSPSLADNVAAEDAPIVANLRRNGAVILGKTNMTEFANYTTHGMPNGYSARGGQVKNAYDPAGDSGGSSSGSAVAVSAGFCAAAVGTDTSFSVVGCATHNGVAGLKPPHGALPGRGIIPISHTLDSAGALARDFSDALLLYAGMRAARLPAVVPADPAELRIGINIFGRDQVSEAQLARYEALFGVLRGAGVSFSQVSHAHAAEQADIMRCEFKKDLEDYLRSSSARRKTLAEIVAHYESDPARMMKYGITNLRAALDGASGTLDDPAYLNAMSERERRRAQVLEDLRGLDACVMTGPTNVMHFTGLPSVALKLCMGDDRVPRGIILYGADETRLYAAALSIEKHCAEVSFPPLGA